MAYVTIAEIQESAYQDVSADATPLTNLIPRASRLFDHAAGVAPAYFEPYVSGDASARKFWGNGTDFLRVDPYQAASITDVSMPTGFTVPSYLECNPDARPEQGTRGEFFLRRVYGDNESLFESLQERNQFFDAEFSGEFDYVGWPAGIKVTVTAKWGWGACPADVKQAVIETIIAIWRRRDPAFLRATNLEQTPLAIDALPPSAKLIADSYRAAQAIFA